ncbi:hypothetical protein ABW21_db0207270 [Orbilia brochopaga]|nr:hypothetical protein ABW21_db0207270 [Drechslerella brochopaga]
MKGLARFPFMDGGISSVVLDLLTRLFCVPPCVLSCPAELGRLYSASVFGHPVTPVNVVKYGFEFTAPVFTVFDFDSSSITILLTATLALFCGGLICICPSGLICICPSGLICI